MSDAASRRRAGLGIWILLSSVLAAVPAAAQPASLVKEINPNFSAASSAPYYFADLDGVAIFGATDADGNELWRSDGTRAGTSKIKDIFPGSSSSYPERMFRWRGHVYFSASDGVRGYELWRTDGTAEGTVLFKDLIPGAVGLSPSLFTPAGDFLYFKAYDASANNTLWRTDGTEAGTCLLYTSPSPRD